MEERENRYLFDVYEGNYGGMAEGTLSASFPSISPQFSPETKEIRLGAVGCQEGAPILAQRVRRWIIGKFFTSTHIKPQLQPFHTQILD